MDIVLKYLFKYELNNLGFLIIPIVKWYIIFYLFLNLNHSCYNLSFALSN
jgi:hypothetical protein